MNLSNITIGRKISLVLGSVVLVLTGLSALSLWGMETSTKLASDSINRLMKSKLAAMVDGETASIARDLAAMILDKQASGNILSEITEFRKSRRTALDDFNARADTPKSIQHGADMAALVRQAEAANDGVIAALEARKYDDAAKTLRGASTVSDSLRVKAREASQWQEKLVTADETKRKETSSQLWIALIAGCLVAIAAAVAGGIVLTRGIATPIAAAVGQLSEIAKGDLSADAPATFQTRRDEIGTLARAQQAMIVSLRTLVQQVSSGVQTLSSSSAELLDSSGHMTSGSREASGKAHSVSAAAEEMSSNISTVAASMEQTTTNLAHVASATEEMTATIGEIARNSEKARRITDEATRQALRITEQINELGTAAKEIGKVTETITEISSQTNLLALNATIEAARAGAAGKGFAVVATEIKALAQQTAAATEDIKGRIAGVQSATAGGIAEIGKISEVIADVSSIVSSIAAAIEEQSAATKDIARHIAEASVGVTDANARVAETSQVSREIAKDIVGVDHAAGEMADGSDHVRGSAAGLATVANELKATVAHFRVSGGRAGGF